LGKPALAHGAIDAVDQLVTLLVLEGFRRDEVIEVEDFVVKPSIALVGKLRYET
jgi:hypothetical protein